MAAQEEDEPVTAKPKGFGEMPMQQGVERWGDGLL